jgi:hypothetical protein
MVSLCIDTDSERLPRLATVLRDRTLGQVLTTCQRGCSLIEKLRRPIERWVSSRDKLGVMYTSIGSILERVTLLWMSNLVEYENRSLSQNSPPQQNISSLNIIRSIQKGTRNFFSTLVQTSICGCALQS